MQVLRRECKKSVIFFFLPRKEYQFRLKYLKTEVILKLKSYKKFCKHLFELGKIPRKFVPVHQGMEWGGRREEG